MHIYLVLAALLQFLNPIPVIRADEVTFTANTARIEFPNTVDFSVSLSSAEEISDVVFLYGTDERTCSEVQAMSLPQFTPGKSVTAAWQWDMRNSGSLPPGTEIWWQWKTVTASGDVVISEKKTVTWIDSIHPWKVAAQDNIRVHYYGITAAQADELLTTALDAVARLQADTGMTVTEPVDLYMYASTEDLRDAVLYEAGWTGGLAFTDYNKIAIGMELKNIEWTKRTEAHELTHVLVGNYTFTCLSNTPTWLEEGLAVLGEGEPDATTRGAFSRAIEDDSLLSFNILSAGFSEDPDKADISYSQSYYMVNYLIDVYGREKINRLLKTLATGTTLDDALREVYGFDLAGFEAEWRRLNGLPPRENAAVTTPLPTVIPTMRPISAVTPVPVTAARQAAAALTPTVSVWLTRAAITPIAAVMPDKPSAGLTGIAILCAIGVVLLAVIMLILFRFRKNKAGGISALVLLILAAAAAGNTSANAAGPEVFPPFPTATVYKTEAPRADVYTNEQAGVSIRIPPYVTIDTTDASPTFFFALTMDGRISGYLKSTAKAEGKSLSEMAYSLRSTDLKDLVNLRYVDDKAVTLADGTPAWLTVTDFQYPQEAREYRAVMVTARGFTSGIALVLYAGKEFFAESGSHVDEFTRSLTVSAPKINGFARDELLVVDSGETENPLENDPATARSSGGFDLVYSGLVTYDRDMNLIPDLARGWDISEDGRVYTFHLQPDALFHNGRPVTADDVVYSWERAAAKAAGSDTVMIYLGDVDGVKEMHDGTADHIRGLTVVDAHTLRVTLSQPVPYFLLKLTYPTTFIVDRENVEQGGKWWLTPNGTGPFRLTRQVAREYRQYERFEAFYGEKPQIKSILHLLYQGTSLQLYENGRIDYAYVGGKNLTRFTDPSEPLSSQLKTTVRLCTGYFTMDTTMPPFDDVKVRQAFAMAVDKEKYARLIGRDGVLPAAGLYPPALPGYDREFKGLEFDPDKARDLIKESEYGGGDMPPVTISTSSYGNSVPEGISALAQMWEENLGVNITIQNIDPDYYQDVLDSDRHGQLISEGWCADYPDPENFADVLFHTGNDMNRSNYANPVLDRLLEDARVEPDPVKRMAMYSMAEKIIMNDAPAVFLTHSKAYVLVKPYLDGFEPRPMNIPEERYMRIDASKFTADTP